MVGILLAFSIHVAMLYLPLGNAFLGTEPVSAQNWLFIFALSLPILFVMEIHKLVRRGDARNPVAHRYTRHPGSTKARNSNGGCDKNRPN